MIILTVSNLTKSFGVDDVLKDINIQLKDGQKLGMVGVNGSGKTTLMRIIADLEPYDGGSIAMKPDMKIGYHAQLDDFSSDRTVMEEMELCFEHVFKIEQRLRQMEEDMGKMHDGDPYAYRKLTNDYTRLMDEFEQGGGYGYKSAILGVLNGLSLPKELYDKNINLLSGGERTRVKLAKLLLQKPDLLLLDEPTNHLDLEAIGWLEDYLASFKGSMILISHDRYFLDTICDSIVEISMGRSEQYEGNYTRYLELRNEVYERRMKEYTQQQKEIARQKAIIERYRRYNQEWSIHKAKTREHVLEKMELVEKPRDESQIEFTFQARRRTGNDVLIAEGLKKSFGERKLFENVGMHIRAGDRIALIGPNGIGKTTLLRIILGLETSDDGEIIYGANLDTGYYDQQQTSLTPKKQIIDEIWDEFPRMSQTQVRSCLGAFLLSGDDVFRTISTLSGGERARVMFTKLMLRGDNFLILDEPTNHLDMDSREVLESALADFTGTIFFVSHDRFFINRIANKVYEMSPDGMREYLGDYDDYISAKRKEEQPPEDLGPVRTKTAIRDEKRREREAKEQRQQRRAAIQKCEKDIAACEEEISRLEALMGDPETYKDSELAAKCAVDYNKEQKRRDELYELWESLQEE